MLRNPEFRQQSKSVNVYQPVIQMRTSAQMKVTGVVQVDDRSKQTKPPNGAGLHPVVAMREYRLDSFSLFSREVRSLEPYVQSWPWIFGNCQLGVCQFVTPVLGRWTLGVLFLLKSGLLESCSYPFIHPSVPENQARSLGGTCQPSGSTFSTLQSSFSLPFTATLWVVTAVFTIWQIRMLILREMMSEVQVPITQKWADLILEPNSFDIVS